MKGFCTLLLALCLSSTVYALEFKGHKCTQDCSGHIAGYEWAKKKDIADKKDCTGHSNSFIEGCRSWVDEQAEPDFSGDKKDQKLTPIIQ